LTSRRRERQTNPGPNAKARRGKAPVCVRVKREKKLAQHNRYNNTKQKKARDAIAGSGKP